MILGFEFSGSFACFEFSSTALKRSARSLSVIDSKIVLSNVWSTKTVVGGSLFSVIVGVVLGTGWPAWLEGFFGGVGGRAFFLIKLEKAYVSFKIYLPSAILEYFQLFK